MPVQLMRAVGFAALALAAVVALAQENYPNRPIRAIVPWVAGGVTDVCARIIGERIGQTLGQPILVEARPGAGSKIGTEAVARAPKDGYTLLFQNSVHTLLPTTAAPLTYDAIRDFSPIVLLASYPFILVVHPSVPAHTVRELIDYAKKNPGKLAYGTGGPGSGMHFATEMFRTMAGIDILHVPYKGAAVTLQAVIAGEIQLSFEGVPKAAIDAGRLRALGTSDVRRDPRFPTLPTLAEAGVAGYQFSNWQGIWAPAGVPRDVVAKLNAAANAALADAGIKAKFLEMGLSVIGGTPEEFAARIREDIATTRKVATDAGLQFN